MEILITGGAGFIGSHLAEKLSRNNKILVFDNLSSGKKDFLKTVECKIIDADITNKDAIVSACEGVEMVYHMAASPDVRRSTTKPLDTFRNNVVGTVNVLEACRNNGVKKIIFASSSTVYGIADIVPTPEEAPILPISNYGAAKAACENYIMSYSYLYGIHGIILRYANIIGPRTTHGVIYDFYNKLKANPKELEILGDGTQKKSYLHVSDCVGATILSTKASEKPFDIFNVCAKDQITVKKIADIIVSHLGLSDVKYKYTGGKIGWKGDVPKFLLDSKKLVSRGWAPKYSTEQAIIDTVDWLNNFYD